MRLNFRIKAGSFTFFSMLAKTQTIEGATSEVGLDRHIVMWDLENCSLSQCEETLRHVQHKFDLSNIYIVSDLPKSYRAWCFTKVGFKTLLQILLDTDYVDYNFFYYTVKRRKATLRTSNKKRREPQQLVSILESYPASIPNRMQRVVYDTGAVKRGLSILLGDKTG